LARGGCYRLTLEQYAKLKDEGTVKTLLLVTIWHNGRATIPAIVRQPAKFRMGDAVRLIGTDTLLTVRQYDEATHEYQVQRGDDDASSQWVLGIYLEGVKSASSQAAG
jgi:hypothetical protein